MHPIPVSCDALLPHGRCNIFSEVADGIVCASGGGVGRCGAMLGGVLTVAFERSADEVAGAKAHGQSEREHDAAK